MIVSRFYLPFPLSPYTLPNIFQAFLTMAQLLFDSGISLLIYALKYYRFLKKKKKRQNISLKNAWLH